MSELFSWTNEIERLQGFSVPRLLSAADDRFEGPQSFCGYFGWLLAQSHAGWLYWAVKITMSRLNNHKRQLGKANE